MKTQRDHYVDSLTLKDFLSTNFKARVWTTDLQLNICVFYLLFNVLKQTFDFSLCEESELEIKTCR